MRPILESFFLSLANMLCASSSLSWLFLLGEILIRLVCALECGRNTVTFRLSGGHLGPRINRGQEVAEMGSWPWMASLGR